MPSFATLLHALNKLAPREAAGGAGCDLYHSFYSKVEGDQVQKVVEDSLLLLPSETPRLFLCYLIIQVLVLSLADILLWKQSFNQK